MSTFDHLPCSDDIIRYCLSLEIQNSPKRYVEDSYVISLSCLQSEYILLLVYTQSQRCNQCSQILPSFRSDFYCPRTLTGRFVETCTISPRERICRHFSSSGHTAKSQFTCRSRECLISRRMVNGCQARFILPQVYHCSTQTIYIFRTLVLFLM